MPVVTYPQGNCLPHLGVRLAGLGAVTAVVVVLLEYRVELAVAVAAVAVLVSTGLRLVRF